MARTADDLIQAEFETQTRANRNPVISSVGTTALEFLRNNPNRIAFVLINLSTNDMWILDDSNPSSSNGIRIAPNGGSARATYKTDYHMIGASWSVVAGGSSSNLLCYEIVTN